MCITCTNIKDFYDKLEGKCIGFAGKLGSGKSYLATKLIAYLEYNSNSNKIETKSFADELRNVVSYIIQQDITLFKHDTKPPSYGEKNNIIVQLSSFCRDNNFIFDQTYVFNTIHLTKTYNDIYRFLLQYVGTDIYRNQVDNNHWVKYVKNKINKNKITIFDDVRFKNELDMINENGVSIYVYGRIKTDENYDHVVNHISENGLTPNDCNIKFNNIIKYPASNLITFLTVGKLLVDNIYIYLNSVELKEFITYQ